MDAFSSIKERNTSLKEINRLLSKEMSNIYLKVTIEKKWGKIFYVYKTFAYRSVFGELQLMQILLNFQTFCTKLKIRGLEAKVSVPFPLFSFWKELWRIMPKSPWFLLNKNVNFNKNETESKKGNPTHSFRETKLVSQLI